MISLLRKTMFRWLTTSRRRYDWMRPPARKERRLTGRNQYENSRIGKFTKQTLIN
jgi:hypothetical protein